MQTRGVTEPNSILASGNTSLVMVQGVLRPGIQKGDNFDIEVRVPGQSETTSLRGGYLLETRMAEMAVLGGQIHEGKLLAKAEGPVMVDPLADPKTDRVSACRGRVLGGGLALKSRSLGLVLKPEHQTVMNSSRIENAVNKRFHSFQNGIKIGVAKAKTEEYVELAVHPRYKDNIDRYVKVVRAVAISETASQRMERIAALEQQLREPATSADAALQLEAIGIDGVPVLLKAVRVERSRSPLLFGRGLGISGSPRGGRSRWARPPESSPPSAYSPSPPLVPCRISGPTSSCATCCPVPARKPATAHSGRCGR